MKKLFTILIPFIVGGLLTSPVLAWTPPDALWSFDDGTSPTMDDTGNGHNGTLIGAPTFDSSDVPLQIGSGNSLSFNGTSNYIALNMYLTVSEPLPELTASVWFRTSFSIGNDFSNWSFLDFDRSEFFNVFVTPSGEIGFSSASPSGINDMYSDSSGLNDGNWHHVAVIYDGINKLIYVDGQLDKSILAHGGEDLGRTGVHPTRFGFIGDGSEALTFDGTRNNILYQGSIDEVAFWKSVALTAEEIAEIAAGASILTIPVGVDIKPGSNPNSINLCSNGSVPVAILGSTTLDVYDINKESLRFADAAVKVVGKKDHTLCSYEDVNGDTYNDLVCKYITTDIAAINGESTIASVNGELLDETPFEGTDSVNIVKDTCN